MSLVPNVSVDFQSPQGYVKIGGQKYLGPDDVSRFISSITAGGFRFPAGGNTPSTFVVTVATSNRVAGQDCSCPAL
jgi:hypothetical protein